VPIPCQFGGKNGPGAAERAGYDRPVPIGTFLRAGLRIVEFEEPICAGQEYPHWLALRASL
jgi:hypothetical protein